MNTNISRLNESDMQHLRRCLALAQAALAAGDQPFGSVLADAAGSVLAEARNRNREIGPLAHPEFELADWATHNLTADERSSSTLYTSGEHCPMCSAAHGWARLGRIVYIASSKQFVQWQRELGIAASPVAALPIQSVVADIEVIGPVDSLSDEIKALHVQYYAS